MRRTKSPVVIYSCLKKTIRIYFSHDLLYRQGKKIRCRIESFLPVLTYIPLKVNIRLHSDIFHTSRIEKMRCGAAEAADRKAITKIG